MFSQSSRKSQDESLVTLLLIARVCHLSEPVREQVWNIYGKIRKRLFLWALLRVGCARFFPLMAVHDIGAIAYL